jgi:hypothetical protein
MTEPPHDISETVIISKITNTISNKYANRKTYTLKLEEII